MNTQITFFLIGGLFFAAMVLFHIYCTAIADKEITVRVFKEEKNEN
jgi:hypothetical protein